MLWLSELESAIIVTRSEVADGRGGTKTTYTDGEEIEAAFTWDDSTEKDIADKDTAIPGYTITTKRDVILQYHALIRRASDGQIFRVTSNSNDNKTPLCSSLNMRQVTAEAWELTT